VVVANQSGDFWKKSLQVRKGRRIWLQIWKIWYTAAGAVTITHQDGSTALSGPADQTSAGASQTFYNDGSPHFTVSIGDAFIFSVSAPVQLSGIVYFTRG
jgi:hypothetical protein